MKKIFQILVLTSFLSLKTLAQDQTYLNTNQSLIFLNPSFAGSNGGIRNQFSYRNDFPNFMGGFSTVGNSFDAFIRPMKAGIALSYVNSDLFHGLYVNSSLNLCYAQYLSFPNRNLKIIPSVQIGYGQKKENLDGWIVMAGSGLNKIPQGKKDYVDVSSGLLVNIRSNWNVGVYVFHINQPEIGVTEPNRLGSRILFHSSYTFHFSEKTQLQIFYRYDERAAYRTNQITANVVLFKYLVTGLSYFSGDQVQIIAGLRSNYFSIQVGYDRWYNKISDNSAGAWELHAAFYLKNKENRKTLSNFENW